MGRKPEGTLEPHQHDEKCNEVFALLSEYLDLELPPEMCRQIESHIAGCGPCIEFTERLRKTVELCRRYKPAELPAPPEEKAKAQLLEAWRRTLANQA
jgi:RNA polymerase sigma-70 factor (ECF subfamily)